MIKVGKYMGGVHRLIEKRLEKNVCMINEDTFTGSYISSRTYSMSRVIYLTMCSIYEHSFDENICELFMQLICIFMHLKKLEINS